MSQSQKLFSSLHPKSRHRRVTQRLRLISGRSSSSDQPSLEQPCPSAPVAATAPVVQPLPSFNDSLNSSSCSSFESELPPVDAGPSVAAPASIDPDESHELDDGLHSSELLELVDEPPGSHLSDYSDDENAIDLSDPVETLSDQLRQWAARFYITQIAVSALLCILRAYECFSSLPKDARTFFRTPSSVKDKFQEVKPGQYYHFSLKEGIIRMLENVLVQGLEGIELLIGIDGIPLFRSSSTEVWPILASIISIPSIVDNLFPMGIFSGPKKPLDCAEFLAEFVKEAKFLVTNGIDINGHHLKVTIRGFSCDAPAKAFILNTKGHSGYFSCTRCNQEGEHIKNRVTFLKTSGLIPRTHKGFLLYQDDEFHHGPTPLTNIPGIQFYRSFVLCTLFAWG